MSDNVEITRSYRDNFSVKELVVNQLIPKYFSDISASKRTVGMIGFTTEMVSNVAEDTFNAISILFREIFPNRATLKESILSYAAIFQFTNAFSTAASSSFLLLLPEDDIVANAEYDDDGVGYFYIEKNFSLYVEEIPFSLDYDIVIRIVKKRLSQTKEDYIFSAQYVTDDYSNSISSISDPFIKIRRTSDGWLAMEIGMHQTTRNISYHNITSNTKINYPVIDVNFSGKLAGFDVLYKGPDDDDYNTQLDCKVIYSQPVKTPFCYYQLTSSNTLQITFNSKENYFQPDFNSEIKVILYITDGADGNFDKYTGDNVTVSPANEEHPYSATVSFVASAITNYSSTGGKDAYSLSQLQSKTIMALRTALALTTENDLAEFFKNYTWTYSQKTSNEIKFVKRRDDVYERVYTAFIIIKNSNYIYHTRTFDLDINLFDFLKFNTLIYSMDPGAMVYYNGNEVRYQCECGLMDSAEEGAATCPVCGTATTYEYVADPGFKFVRDEDLYNEYYSEYVGLKYKAENPVTRVWDYTNDVDELFTSTAVTEWDNNTSVSIIYNGVEYTKAIEMNSDTSFTFTAEEDGDLIIVSYSTKTTPYIKINDDNYAVSTEGYTDIRLSAGEYTITCGTTDTYIYYMSFAYTLEDDNDIWEIDQSTTSLADYLVGRVCSYSEWLSKKGYDDKLTIFDVDEDFVAKYDDPRSLKFLYINPFLWRFCKNPNLFTMYYTAIDQSIVWDYVDQNEDSYINFVTRSGNLKREFTKEKKYTLTISTYSSVDVDWEDHPLINIEDLDNRFSVESNDLRVLIVFTDSSGNEVAYTEMYPSEFDETDAIITFKAEFETDDYITSSGELRLDPGTIYRNSETGDYYEVDSDDATVCYFYNSSGENYVDEDGEDVTISWDELKALIADSSSGYEEYSVIKNLSANDYILIPCGDVTCKLVFLYNRIYDADIEGLRNLTSDETNNNYYQYDSTLDGYMWVDNYSSETEPFTFIEPLYSLRSAVEFDNCVTTTITPAYSAKFIWDCMNGVDELFTTATANTWDDAANNPVTYNDVSYTAAIKMESTTLFEFTTDHNGTLTIVSFSDTYDEPYITIDEEDVPISNNGYVEIELRRGKHVISKGTTNTYIYYMVYGYSVEETEEYDAEPLDCTIQSLPWIAASIVLDSDSLAYFFDTYLQEYKTLTSIINTRLRNASNMDVKLFNTYGTTNYFLIGEEGVSEILNTLNLKIEFDVWFVAGTDPIEAVPELRSYIKAKLETTNDNRMNSLYISNLIKQIETKFAYVDHLRFVTINDYDSTYQNIYNYVDDLDDLTKEERRNYVPEILNIEMEDIVLNYEVLDY